MKYRFSSLDQIVNSPLFNLTAPYQRPERMDRCTRPTRLERMAFHDSCTANGLDAAAPLLADLFHLLYAYTYRWGSEKELSPKARLVWAYLLDGLQDNGQFAALHHLCRGEDSAAMEAARTVRQALSEAVQGLSLIHISMRFLANRSELLPIARRCSQTIGTYFVSKEHACVLMEADAASNTVMFTARSRTCTLQVRHACRVEESGRALLFAPVFQRMLDAFADEATSVATDGRQIEVRNAKAAFVFPLMDADKYPAVGTPAPAQLLDCSGFAEVSARVLFSAAQGKAEGKEQLKCVHLTVHDGKFSAASCDGFRMTVARDCLLYTSRCV